MTFLGIDIGGTKVALRVERDGGEAYQSAFAWVAEADPEQDLQALARELDRVRSRWPATIEGVGVAVPATLDPGGQVVSWPGRPSWVGMTLSAALAGLLPGAMVRCADDGDLAAYAEAAAAAGERDLLYIGVGTGIGGGMVLDGRPIRGLVGASVEVGHMVIDRSGPPCDCGRHGCLQAVASGPATLRRAAALRDAPVEFSELHTALAQDRSWATAAVAETCDALAAAVVSVNELMHPSVAVIGGGFAAGLPGLVDTVAEAVGRWARPGHPPPAVRPAALGGLSSLHGAVRLARECP